MTKEQELEMNTYYSELVKRGVITTLNEANVFKLSYEKALTLNGVVKSLPSKDEFVSEGYRIARYRGYNYRRVLRDRDNDIYYSGWMDCYDWITK